MFARLRADDGQLESNPHLEPGWERSLDSLRNQAISLIDPGQSKEGVLSFAWASGPPMGMKAHC